MNFFLICISIIFSASMQAQKTCAVKNQSFKSGEELSYQVYYNWGAIWMNAGEAGFSTATVEFGGKTMYHFVGSGSTYPSYDWFFKVRDKYESYADTASLRPLRFSREVSEGFSTAHDDYIFNQQKNKIYTADRKNKKMVKLDSIAITPCTNDLITAVFYARCLDFSKCKPKDTIPITYVLDGKVYFSYVRYLGKETIKNDLLGDIRCIKFSPKLLEGTIFKGGEGMVVWVTDDKNKMPVYVETPIIVGTIKVKLSGYKGLRNTIDALVPK